MIDKLFIDISEPVVSQLGVFCFSELTFCLNLCYGTVRPLVILPLPPVTDIFSSLMDGAMNECQLGKLKRLILKPENDSDKAAFYYSIYHSILHCDILPLNLTFLLDVSFS